MADITMVVPTYWTRSEGGAGRVVFDHPTPLDQEGTLRRLLDSIEVLDRRPDRVVVIAVPDEPAIADDVERKVRDLVAGCGAAEVNVLGPSAVRKLQERLASAGASQGARDTVNMDNYAAVRNLCSLAGILHESHYTVFIDDDEVFADGRFLEKVEADMNAAVNGDRVRALAGYYLQPDTYRLDESKVPQWRIPWWNNAAAMNEAFDLMIGSGERLKPTPFVFGGNMTLALDVLIQVPFDPKITRGEDIDFLLNLRISGTVFYLDSELSIRHLPPPSHHPDWRRFREDAIRYLYERKKVRDNPELSLEELQPYPGRFLGDDLEERILKSCERLRRDYESRNDREGMRACDEIAAIASNDPFADFDTRSWLEEISTNWREAARLLLGAGLSD